MTGDRSTASPGSSGGRRGSALGQTNSEERLALFESLFSHVAVAAGLPAPERGRTRTASTQAPGVRDSVEVTGLYIISVAARLTEMHPQTLRKYERVGLIRPSRTRGSLRLYSEEDLARLRLIRNLTDSFGLNLAGVRLVMELVSHLHHVLEQVESSADFLQTSGGRAVKAELDGLLEALETG
ncbi:MAG: MerR family transcriptional regulator [Chloroflexi bacterium]|nr:MerR family transcriptional regulator [Chloroflexota bacterium]